MMCELPQKGGRKFVVRPCHVMRHCFLEPLQTKVSERFSIRTQSKDYRAARYREKALPKMINWIMFKGKYG